MTARTVRVPESPPADPEAEGYVLGAVLLSPRLLDALTAEIQPPLRPDHFYGEGHRLIYAAMLELDGRNVGIDFKTVQYELEARGTLDRAGGEAMLDALAGTVPYVGNVRQYAQRVVDLAGWRTRLAGALGQLDAVATMDEEAFVASAALAETAAEAGHDGLMRPDDLALEWTDWYDADDSDAIPTPWPKITEALRGGFRPGDTTIVCGHSGKGKTTIGDQILEYAKTAKGLAGCAYINEMSRVDRVSRLLAGRAGVDFSRIMRRDLRPEEIKRVLHEAPRLPFAMQPCSGWSAERIARHLRRHRWPIAFVDLATRIPAQTTAEWDRVSGVLNDAARQAGTHLLLAVQLNRERNTGELRPMPVLRDLRNTGAWEADARNVLIVHRAEEIDPVKGVPVSLDEGVLHLAKVSNGRPGAESVVLNYRTMRFDTLIAETGRESEWQ